MKRLHLFIILIIITGLAAAAAVENPDKPANGTWDFKMEKVWSLTGYDGDVFASIGQIRIDNDGKLYVHDGKNGKYLSFSQDGKFIKSYGKKGEGPGEIKWINQARFYPINDKIIIADADKIHYFTKDFQYLKSVRNRYFQRRPTIFIDEDRFITAPLLMLRKKDKQAKIKMVDLKTDEEKVVAGFDVYKGGTAQKGGMRIALVVGGLTPMMTIGYDEKNKRLFYGMNDRYTIDVSSLDGKKITSFELDRDPVKISDKEKRDRFKDDTRTPKEMLDQIIKQLPDTGTYFDKIEIQNNLVFVYCSDLERKHTQLIDIFSADGKYLYRAEVKITEGNTIDGGPIIKDGYMYIGIEDEDGEYLLNKYKIQLPSH
jgi:hypothetical protein